MEYTDDSDSYMEMNFCRRCGTGLPESTDHVYKCPNGHILYANASPAVGILFLTDDNQVILAVRGIEPHKGRLDAFGGFLDGAETFEAAAERELLEELSLTPDSYEELRYLISGVDVYSYGGEEVPYVGIFFWTRLKTTKPLIAADDVAGVRQIPLHDIDPQQLHAADTRAGIRALQRLFPK